MTTKSGQTSKQPPTAASQLRALVSGKRARLWLAALVVVATGYASWQYVTDPPRPWLVRWRVQRYLQKQAHTSDFKVDFPFPSEAEMKTTKSPPSTPLKGTQTGRDFDTLCDEYFALKSSALNLERRQANRTARGREVPASTELQEKEAALAPIVSDLWDFQRAWQAEANSPGAVSASQLARAREELMAGTRQKLAQAQGYSEMYRLIGQEIWVANQLLGSANPDHRRAGVSLALAASHQALNDAQNGWVAARICEGYVWPNLDLADSTSRRSPFHPENLLNECADIFRQNNEFSQVVRVYEQALVRAGNSARADDLRVQLSLAHEQAGDLRLALASLRQIQRTNDYRGVMRRVPRLEQQLKAN